MPKKQKVSNEVVAESYERLGNIWLVGEEVGVSGQTVQRRLVKMNIDRSRKPITVAEKGRLIDEYEEHANGGTLDDLARDMGRTKQYICRHAGALGLTNQGRAKPYMASIASKRMRDWHAANDHPKGMLGKHHTQETKDHLAITSANMWSGWSAEKRDKIVEKQMRAKIKKYGTIAPNVKRGSWKAAWHEIGGTRKYYRSRWEANYAYYLQWLLERGEIAKWEHEPKTFWFEKIKRGTRSYLPDFRVTENDGSEAFHEVKGWMDDRSKTKIKRMRIYHPDVTLIVIGAKEYKAIQNKASRLVPGWDHS